MASVTVQFVKTITIESGGRRHSLSLPPSPLHQIGGLGVTAAAARSAPGIPVPGAAPFVLSRFAGSNPATPML
jgi:hypothetical protein